tara:strand:- start:867 stop:1727 length:861 start_codon:yes stop_codon:yes gene_type:complete
MDYDKGGISGLVNLGNTCFMNTTIQCMGHNERFRKFIINTDFHEKDQKLCYQFKRLLKGLWENNCIVNPVSFFKTIKTIAKKEKFNINFTGFAQNDIHEFINFILEIMESESESFFKKNYYGSYNSIIKDIDRKQLSKTQNKFNSILLPLKGDSLGECIEEYLSDEYLDDENKYLNEKTNEYINAYKKISFTKMPNELIISLNRFTNQGEKLNQTISFPFQLKISKKIYNLVSIGNHSGNMFGGHYYSYCKHGEEWYNFNDSATSKIDKTKLITPSAYVLFYSCME